MYTNIMHGGSAVQIREDVDNLDLGGYVAGGKLNLVLVIDSGVTVGTPTTSTAAIYSSLTIDKGGTLVLQNAGTILGCNGAGGAGSKNAISDGPGKPGFVGADAIDISCDITVHNLLGVIHSGGGGGGGGGASGPLTGGSGGGGFNGGPGYHLTPPTDGDSSQYGYAAGGPAIPIGGECDSGIDGTAGASGNTVGGAGGSAGIAINSSGNTITIVSGAATILGGTA